MLAATVLTATLLAVPATAGAATGTTSIALSGPAASSLKANKVKLIAASPAKATAKRLNLTAAGGSVSGNSAAVSYGGSLRLKAGKRSVRLTNFKVVLDKKPRVTARLGGSTLTLATLKFAKGKAAKIDAGAQTVSLTGATATVPTKTAKTLAKKLKLRKLSGGRLGSLKVSANLATAKPAPAPVPAPATPAAPAPAPLAPPVVVDPPVVPPTTPEVKSCPAPSSPVTTVGQTDWSIRPSFVKYLYDPWTGPGPTTTAGIFATDGASQIDPSNREAYRFGVTGATTAADGTITVDHTGTLAFVLTAHYLNIRICNPRIEISPDGTTGKLYADGQGSGTQAAGMSGNAEADVFTDQLLFDLTFDGAPTAGIDAVVHHATTVEVANQRAAELLSNPAGTPYGKLDVAVPLLGLSGVDWTQTNDFAGTTKTFLGYTTASFLGNGTLTPSAGATGDTVTPASPRGSAVTYRTRFQATSSTYSAAPQTGVAQFTGKLTFASVAHGFTISVENPRIEFIDATHAKLYASGASAGDPAVPTYDTSLPLFDLALPATPPAEQDGIVTINNVAPSLSVAGRPFPGNYAAGSGPDRTPNTFGSFSIRIPKAPAAG